MTGLLTQAAATEHLHDLRAAAAGNRGFWSRHRPRRVPAA
jgi:hypothetical protein